MKKSDVGANFQELVVRVVKRLVDNPDQVELSEKEGDSTLVFVVSTAKEDVGKLIGRHGVNISAVRTLVASAAGKYGKRVFVEVKEPDLAGDA
jgi:predicted RNA-binding protein YlqC (UPF0109 family)